MARDHPRRSVNKPERYENGEHPTPRHRNVGHTKPAFPKLLAAQVVPFNPNNRSAAFPSLPLTSKSLGAENNNLNNRRQEEGDTQARNDDDTASEEPQSDEDVLPSVEAAETYPGPSVIPSVASAALSTVKNNRVSWSDLPISLQYHIYQALIMTASPERAVKALGLTAEEIADIKHAVGLRATYPATVAAILDLCSRGDGQEFGGDSAYLDVDMFNEYQKYDKLARDFELALEAEVLLAKNFIRGRGIRQEILGTWLPDPSHRRGSEFWRYVSPSDLVKFYPKAFAVTRAQEQHDSGYSSMSEKDRKTASNAIQKGPKRKYVHKAHTPRPSTNVNMRPHPAASSQVNCTGDTLRHPLAAASKPEDFILPTTSSTAPTRMHMTQHDTGHLNRIALPTTQSRRPLADKQPRLASEIRKLDKQKANTDAFKSKLPSIETDSEQGPATYQESVLRANSPRLAPESSPAASPVLQSQEAQRLVMEVQSETGLAQVFRAVAAATTSETPALEGMRPYASDLQDRTSTLVPGFMTSAAVNLNTKMTPFDRKLLLNGAPKDLFSTANAAAFANDPRIPPRAETKYNSVVFPLHHAETLERFSRPSTPAPIEPSKRKPSQSDIRSEPGKVPRLSADEVTPVKPIQANVNNVDEVHTMAKSMDHAAISAVAESLDAPMNATDTRTLIAQEGTDSVAPDIPRSPTPPEFSPLYDSEQREEVHELLKSPRYQSRLKPQIELEIKVPPKSDLLPSKSDVLPTPYSSGFPSRDSSRNSAEAEPSHGSAEDSSPDPITESVSTIEPKRSGITLKLKLLPKPPLRVNTSIANNPHQIDTPPPTTSPVVPTSANSTADSP
jgi:hypothetical protein